MPWVGEPPVQFWQFFKHIHEDSEAGSLTAIERPARWQNFLQRVFVARYLHLVHGSAVQTKQVTEHCGRARVHRVFDILTPLSRGARFYTTAMGRGLVSNLVSRCTLFSLQPFRVT